MRWLRKLLPWLIIAASIAVSVYIPELGPERYTDLATLFKHERGRQANAGFSVAVCRNGSIIYQESFGKDGSGQPLAKDTPMYLGPSSEILSGALLYSLSLQKVISLDEDIRTYLPGLPLFSRNSLRTAAAIENPTLSEDKLSSEFITVRQLASQSVNLNSVVLKEFGTKISGLEAGELNPEQFIKSRLASSGSTRSRLVYRILGSAMENVTKTSFDELLQSRILIPLGMHGTTSKPDSLQGVAVGSGLFFGLSFPYDSRVPDIAAPADGIVTTAEDIAKFLSYITAPPRKGIASLPPSSVAGLYQPLLPDGDTGFGWRISEEKGNRIVFQGGSVEGFSSRVVIWPERNVGIAILSAQGGVIQSNIVLPLLTSAAEKVLFTGSSPRPFPVSRMLVIVGIVLLVYLISLFWQASTSSSWTKALIDQQETGHVGFFQKFAVIRTAAGIIVRAGLLVAAPYLVGKIVGRPLVYHDLLIMEPGGAAFFIVVMIAAILRNISRLVWIVHMRHG